MRPLALALALTISFTAFTRAYGGSPQTNDVSTMSRQQLSAALASTNINLVNAAFARLYTNGITYDELAPIFKNPSAEVRLRALDYLRRSYNSDAKAIDLMIPLLRDPDKNIRLATAMVLQSFTGQEIPADQTGEWEKRWAKYRPYYELMERARILQQVPQTGRDYHSRGVTEYDLRNFTNALVDFRMACRLGSDATDYSWCRLWLVQARLGDRDSATKDLKAYLNQRPGNPADWAAQIARFLAGDITEADLFRKASIPGAESAAGQLCEAYFYIGSKDLIEGDKKAATQNFKECLATRLSAYEEYSSAQAELGIPVPPQSEPSEVSDHKTLNLHLAFGQRLGGIVAGPSEYRGFMYRMKDGKLADVAGTSPVDMFWSADKSKIIAMVLDNGPIYETTNYGMNWQVFSAPGKYTFWLYGNESDGGFSATGTIDPGPMKLDAAKVSKSNWYMVAAASDGTKLVLSDQSAPAFSIKYAGSLMLVSWPSSFTGFVLQQNSDPTTTNWTDTPRQVQAFNGQYQVMMPSDLGSDFYRLKSKSQ